MFRLKPTLKNFSFTRFLLPIEFCSHESKFFSSTSSLKQKITLPEIKNKEHRDSVLSPTNNGDDKYNKSYKFYRFYGDRAYNYYTTIALNLKIPDANRAVFIKIYSHLITRKFLGEVAKVCELDKMMSKNHVTGCLGERMEAYCSGMLLSGMDDEMKKFTSDVVDYYFAKENKDIKQEIIKKDMTKDIALQIVMSGSYTVLTAKTFYLNMNAFT
ncbi:1016_t:CDS:2 [Funneliformis geosporum]|uniref:4173_t:CDS:1 n=1 Tax=Funneliformis geosporum TaxID=1117311 RepID=A0A9W4SG39_9GLOM|nr:1016_t:CDS:2 [Funneliformis geosporum]CAI2167149.1 4173_t:CDS:2 [Funneliformis geosporum]